MLGNFSYCNPTKLYFGEKALGKLGTGKAMPLNITYAAWSLPFSYLLLHQVPGTKDIICALVVLLGALLAAYEKPQKLEKSNNR